jgi:DeoR family transcriptional regulator, copper-sensing transcriptional repressor
MNQTGNHMSKTPAARQREILELLDARHILTIQELATELGVSAMTVHRDLNKLASSGRLVKTHGGVALPSQAQTGSSAPTPCAMCRRPVPERSAVIMQSPRLGRLTACCPHCGLTLLDRGTSADLMLVTDFLNCHVVSANDATYLVGTDVESCCRPVILAFASPEGAERFQRGFGGEIMSLLQVRGYLHHGMCVSCAGPSHATHSRPGEIRHRSK